MSTTRRAMLLRKCPAATVQNSLQSRDAFGQRRVAPVTKSSKGQATGGGRGASARGYRKGKGSSRRGAGSQNPGVRRAWVRHTLFGEWLRPSKSNELSAIGDPQSPTR